MQSTSSWTIPCACPSGTNRVFSACICGSLTCQVLSPWKKKNSANPQTTAVRRINTNGRHWILSPLRSYTQTHADITLDR